MKKIHSNFYSMFIANSQKGINDVNNNIHDTLNQILYLVDFFKDIDDSKLKRVKNSILSIDYNNLDYIYLNRSYNDIKDYLKNYISSRKGEFISIQIKAFLYLFNRLIIAVDQYSEKNIDITYHDYTKIIGFTNNEISKYILKGNSFMFTRCSGIFDIRLKKTNINRPKPDWGASLKNLMSICKNDEDCKDILVDYKNREINKKEFINKTNTILKQKHIKWLIYNTNDKELWFHWSKTFVSGNLYTYRFRPTNFINTKERSQIKFAETASSKDDIINSNLLGNRDKLNILKRFDPSIVYTYKEY